jgi:hypothetical protein
VKLTDFPSNRITVEGVELEVYVEVDEPLQAQVYLDVLAHYDDETGNRKRKDLHQLLSCTPMMRRSNAAGAHAYTVKWTANLSQDAELAGRFLLANYRVRGVSAATGRLLSAMSPDVHGIVGIDVTSQTALTRIMLHEFATLQRQPDNDIRAVFDSSELNAYLATLTVQQKKLLLKTALQYPQGRLVTFVTLYPRKALRMNADWVDESNGVVPNATFSVFHCRNEPRSSATPKSTSAITLVCHTRYFVLNIVNPPTLNWITKRVYDGNKPNQWLSKATEAPILFKIAALEPSSKCDGVIWSVILDAGTGENIMPGNALHGMINTKGCWMLFRNFNWPLRVTDELDRIYRKLFRTGLGKAAVIAELAKAGYNIAPGSEQSGYSSSYDKFLKYDRNWAYQWFFHEIVGIKYFSSDIWGYKKVVNDFNVHGHEMSKSFPLNEAARSPAYNAGDEADYAYHDFDHHKLPIGSNLFRTNALGFKTASAFAKSMHAKLSATELASCSWSDIYFFKKDGLDAERMTAANVKEF